VTPGVAGRRRWSIRGSGVAGWQDVDGEPMFVVDLTPAGFPIGMRQESEPHWFDEE